MLDIRTIREHPEDIQNAARQRHIDVDVYALLRLDSERRELKRVIEELQRRRNDLVRAAQGEKPSNDALTEGRRLKEALHAKETAHRDLQASYEALLLALPNLPTEDTPIGTDASGNLLLREWGTPPSFDFTPKEHWQIGESLGIIDTERASRVSGSRFTYLLGDAALIQFALIQFAFSVLTNETTLSEIARERGLSVSPKPWIPVIPPVLIKPDVMARMARLEPKEDRYHILSDDLYLVGSAEHTLGPLHLDETFHFSDLPRRYVGFSTAFRREAGSYGKDVHGIIRMHQFDKLEMESFSLPASAREEQEFIVGIQEYLVRALGLPYRVMLLCTGDMGAPNARQVDVEVWFPGQQQYRETHSADYMTDYQSRRLHTKVHQENGDVVFVHMNDATVLAMGRTIAAILENYQRPDGSVEIPSVLRPYMGGKDSLARPG